MNGMPDLVEETELLRQTLSSPDIPQDLLLLAHEDSVLKLDLTGLTSAFVINSPLISSVIRGLHKSWADAVKRIS